MNGSNYIITGQYEICGNLITNFGFYVEMHSRIAYIHLHRFTYILINFIDDDKIVIE